MIARVDGVVVAPDALWWPAMNFDQFHWDYPIGVYELAVPWVAFVEQLGDAYDQCTAELRTDDALVPNQSSCPLRDADYPTLDDLPNYPAAFFEAVRVYLWDDLFTAFLPYPSGEGRFMVNSIDEVSLSSSVVIVRGRGYHASRE